MATSPNYAWAEPDNSSLVKNGASDIRTLGDAIDTSVWNVGFGQAGKNKIMNGDMAINQRNFTSVTTNTTFTFDRFFSRIAGDGTATFTPQTFTLGSAPVAGYEGKNFIQIATAGQTSTGVFTVLRQIIENVRTFAGQTVTVSFWAKATTATPKVSVSLTQTFGAGGSTGVTTTPVGVTLSTGWARYSTTFNLPSIAGKTITLNDGLQLNLCVSAGSTFTDDFPVVGIQNNTFQFWGVQVEYGSKATPFQTASGGSPQAELAMCQRYLPAIAASNGEIYTGQAYSTTAALIPVVFPVTARVAPTGITVNSAGNFRLRSAVATKLTTTAINFSTGTVQGATIEGIVAAGLVAGNATNLFNESSGTILFTGCEL